MNPTSSIKIYEVRNTNYQLGSELRFHIPPSVIALNPLETYFTCHLEVGGSTAQQLANQYALNSQIGAEALVRELTILNGSESAVLEQITSYNRLKRVLAYYHNNKTDDNLCKLMSGGQDISPVLATNRLFDKDGTGAVTQKKIEVMFKLSLSGIFSSTKPFPSLLTDGLIVKIMLENDINKVLERMSERTAPRLPSAHNIAIDNKDFFKRPIGCDENMCYQVAYFNTAAAPADGAQVNTLLTLNTRNVDTTDNGIQHDDNTTVEGGNYQILTPNVQNNPFSIGQVVKLMKDDNSNGVDLTITDIALDNSRIQLTFDSVDTSNGASNNGPGDITSKIFIYDQGQQVNANVQGSSAKSTLTVSNVVLVAGILNLNSGEVGKLQKAAASKGGYNFDYPSYVDYAVNITKALTNSAYIPCKLNRTKSLLSFWEDVGSSTNGSRDNLLPIVDANTAVSQYNYKIGNLIVPNRPVSLTNYNKEPDIAGRWGAIHLSQMEYAIEEAGVQVRSLEDIANCLVIGRQLAKYNHTFDMSSSKGETRLEVNFTTNTRDLLIHNFVSHLRRLTITPQSTFVEM